MHIGVGDHVIVESRRLIRPRRTGVVVAIVHSRPLCYRVRWDDGHMSELTPTSGALTLDRQPPGRRHNA
jgi:hypothetical protein